MLAHIKHVCFSTLLWPSGQLALVRTFPEVRTEPCPEATRGPNSQLPTIDSRCRSWRNLFLARDAAGSRRDSFTGGYS